jgi:hypothetical protein
MTIYPSRNPRRQKVTAPEQRGSPEAEKPKEGDMMAKKKGKKGGGCKLK